MTAVMLVKDATVHGLQRKEAALLEPSILRYWIEVEPFERK